MIRFKTTKAESALIDAAVARAVRMWGDIDVLSTQMDLTACNANGCPLDFTGLVAADDFNFSHDMLGTRRHLNRGTGKLEGCFEPRFAKRQR